MRKHLQSGNFTQNTGSQFLFLLFSQIFLIEVYFLTKFLFLLNSLNKHWKNTGNKNVGKNREIC